MTGGRVARVRKYIGDESFMLTYGDGVSDVDISALVSSHKKSGKLATLTAVQTTGKFGALKIDEGSTIRAFEEKPHGDGAWINGGFFVLEPGIFDYIKEGDTTIWERSPLEGLARDGQLNAYKHNGFWKPMDTLRDRYELEDRWMKNRSSWKKW